MGIAQWRENISNRRARLSQARGDNGVPPKSVSDDNDSASTADE